LYKAKEVAMRRFTLVALFVSALTLVVVGQTLAGCAPDSMWMKAWGAGGEYMLAVHNTADGGFILGGSTTSYGAGYSDWWLVRLDSDGDTLWTRTYGGSGDDDFADMRVVPAGGYVLCGSKQDEASNTDIWVVRTDDDGDTLWTWTYSNSIKPDWGASVQPMANGDFAVLATGYPGGGTYSDIYLYLLDSDGEMYSSHSFGGLDNETAMVIRQASDGGFVFTGWTKSYGSGPDDVYLVKTYATGALEWQKWYGGAGSDEGRDVIITADGGYLIAGNTSSYGTGGDAYVIKTNSSGDTLWTRNAGGTVFDRANGVIEASDGTIVTVGDTESFGSGDMSFFVAAFDQSGYLQCTDTYGTDGMDGAVKVVETLDQGFLIVGGTAPAGTYDWKGMAVRAYGQAPLIHSIADVPYDQGGKVRIVWGRSSHDVAEGDPAITGYAIYRKYDWGSLAEEPRAGTADFPKLGYPPGDWDYVTTVPARYEDVYSTVVPTLCDSTAEYGTCWSFFFISALTGDPGFYFDSAPDSGYSIDNLAPSPPANLHMTTELELAWDEAPEEDFDYFTVYASATSDFGASFRLGYTAETTFDVTGDTHPYYFVTATDFAGNEGDPAVLENEYSGVSRTIPSAYGLRSADSNPFRGRMALFYDLPSPCPVRIQVIDVAGRSVRTLVDRAMPAGTYSVTWDGCDNAGAPSGPGVYFIRMSAGRFEAVNKVLIVR
jgi:hypothetical protein